MSYYFVIAYRVYIDGAKEGKIYCPKCFGQFNHISWQWRFTYDSVRLGSRLAKTKLVCSDCGEIITEGEDEDAGDQDQDRLL